MEEISQKDTGELIGLLIWVLLLMLFLFAAALVLFTAQVLSPRVHEDFIVLICCCNNKIFNTQCP